MADGHFPTLVSKSRDTNAVANPIWIQLTDGTTAISVTSNAIDVNVDNTVAVTGTFYRDLVKGIGAGEDNVLIFANTAKDGSGTDYVPLVDSDGNLQVDVLTMPSVTVTASDLDIRTLDHVTPGDSVKIGDGTSLLDVNTDGSINVNIISSAITGEICSYDTEAGLAADTPDNHDYPVTGTVMLLSSVIAAASGGLKFEVQVGPVATLVTKAVGFIPKEGGVAQIFFEPPIEVPVASTGTVRVIRTNRQGATQDVYSTIIGRNI